MGGDLRYQDERSLQGLEVLKEEGLQCPSLDSDVSLLRLFDLQKPLVIVDLRCALLHFKCGKARLRLRSDQQLILENQKPIDQLMAAKVLGCVHHFRKEVLSSEHELVVGRDLAD